MAAPLDSAAALALRWAALGQWLGRAAQMALMLAFARVLTPQEYGLLDIVISVNALGLILQDLGLSRALVQSPDLAPASAIATFWSHLLLSVATYGLIFLTVPFLAGLLTAPAVIPLVRIAALQLLLVALGTVPMTLMQRALDFRRQGMAQLAGIGALVLIASTLLLAGARAWAFVLGSLAGSAVQTVLYWRFHGWRPGLPSRLFVSRPLLVFGTLSTLEILQGWILNYGDNLIVGTVLGLETLGVYALAFTIAVSSLSLLLNPLASVGYVYLSRLNGRPRELTSVFLSLFRLTAGVAFPAAVGLALTAALLSRTVLGGRWSSIVPVIQMLALFPGVAHALVVNPELYKAMGRPEIMPRLLGVTLAYSLPVYLLGARFGILGFCLARASVSVIFFPVHLAVAARLLRIRAAALWRVLGGPAAATTGMAALVGLVLLAVSSSGGGLEYVELALAIGVGVGSYLTLLACLDRSLARSAVRLVRFRSFDPLDMP
jgi:O-antigen/teichoic acid export membrane protein